MADISQILSGLTAGAEAQIQQNNTAAQSYSQDTAAIRNLLTINEQESAVVAEQAAEAARADAAMTFRVNKAKEANTAIAGMNPEDLNNQYIQSMAEYNAAEDNRKQVRSQYDAAVQTDLLSNPLGYLVAQLKLPQLVEQNNSAVARRDAASSNIAARVGMIRAKDSIIAANTAQEAYDLSLKKANIAKQTADIQLRQVTAENMSKLGTMGLEVYRLSQDQFKIQREVLQTEMSIKQWQATQQATAEARAERSLRAQAEMEAKKTKQEDIDTLNGQLAAASAALGYQQPFTISSTKLLKKDKQDALVAVAQNGTFGGDLQQSIATVNLIGNQQVIGQTNIGMGKFMQRAEAGIKSYTDVVTREAAVSNIKLKKGEAEVKGSQVYEVDLINSAQSFGSKQNLTSNKWDESGVFNPYKPEYLALIDAAASGQIPQLKDNKALATLATMRNQLAPNANNFRGEDMQRMVQVMARQVADKTLGLEDAAKDIVALHQVGAKFNSGLYNYTQFGLPMQTSAIMTVPGIAALADTQKLDAMSLASTKATLAKLVSQSSTLDNIGNPFVLGERGAR